MAGIGNTLKSGITSAANSLFGNLEQAILEIEDYRAAAAATANQMMTQISNSSAGGPLTQSDTNILSNAAQAVAGQTFAAGNFEKKTFKVQFNPSEIQLDSVAFPQNMANALDGGAQSLLNDLCKPRVDLTLRLYFDAVNLSDSFMWEKFTSGVSAQSAVNIASAVAGTKGKVWTVQTQVEGLVAALRNMYTRRITFHWADFSFSGQLNTIMAQYTMFSTSGRPVRAQVLMRLRQDSSTAATRGNWKSDFDKAFGGTGAKIGSLTSGMGSLLNF